MVEDIFKKENWKILLDSVGKLFKNKTYKKENEITNVAVGASKGKNPENYWRYILALEGAALLGLGAALYWGGNLKHDNQNAYTQKKYEEKESADLGYDDGQAPQNTTGSNHVVYGIGYDDGQAPQNTTGSNHVVYGIGAIGYDLLPESSGACNTAIGKNKKHF